jgi:hypothetical protein
VQGTKPDRGQDPTAGRLDDVAPVAPSPAVDAPWPRRAGRGCRASLQPAPGGQAGRGADGAGVARAG